ncbi:hypothetical protein OSTOST_21077, partial [Ostertagia ostertagi]
LIDKQFPSTERGDALVFLNGVAEITTVAEALKTYAELTKGWVILMLHRARVIIALTAFVVAIVDAESKPRQET